MKISLSTYNKQTCRPLAVLIGMVLILSVLHKNGSQPAVLLIFLMSVPLCFIKPEHKSELQGIWLLMLFAPMLASIPLFAGSGTGEAFSGALRYMVAGVCFLGLRHFPFDIRKLFRVASAAGILTIALNLDQFNMARANWGVGHLESSYLLIVLLSLSLSHLYIDRDKPLWRLLAIIAVVVTVIAALMTGTRGTWPAIFTVFILHLFLLDMPRSRKLAILVAGLILVSASARFIPAVSDRIDETTSELKAYYEEDEHANSIGYRMDFWRIAIESFSESPLWGVSYQRRSEIMESYMERFPASKHIGNDGRSSSHNEILNAMAKKGILGLIAILLLYIVPLHFFIRHLKSGEIAEIKYASLAGIGIVLTMMICGITEAPLMNVRVGATYAMILVFLHHLISQTTVPGALSRTH